MPDALSLSSSASPALSLSSPVSTNSNPFPVFSSRLNLLLARNLHPNHVVNDLSRIVDDLIITAATHCLQYTADAYTGKDADDTVQLMFFSLLDADLITVHYYKSVHHVRQLKAWVNVSTARQAQAERVIAAVQEISQWCQALAQHYDRQEGSSTPESNYYWCRKQTGDGESIKLPVVSNASPASPSVLCSSPFNWSSSEYKSHCQPLWNTDQLELFEQEEATAQQEKELEEARNEAIKATKAVDAERQRRDKEKRRLAAERSKAKSERQQRLLAEEMTEEEAKEEEEEEARQQAAVEKEEEEDPIQPITIPPVVVSSTRFTFCCMICHSVVLSAADIDRVYANRVWTKKSHKLSTLVKNPADSWTQRAAEMDAGADKKDKGEEETEDNSQADHAALFSLAAHCQNCHYYLGRFFPSLEQYRLTYIDRLTGRNFLFFTGDTDKNTISNKLQPLINSIEKEITTELEDEQQDNQKKTSPSLPIIGLPAAYTSREQALLRPFPRYTNPAVQQRRREQQTQNGGGAFSSSLPPYSAAQLSTLLTSYPDPLYSFPAKTALEQIQSLQRVDVEFLHRCCLSVVTHHVERLFNDFSSSPYKSVRDCPIPAFTHFYLHPPQFTHSRGTARYLWHFLTGRDDSQCKRYNYSWKKLKEARDKMDQCVLFLCTGGWGGMRSIIVKVGQQYRLFQSNHALQFPENRYTIQQWLSSNTRWSRVLNVSELDEFFALFELARRGDRDCWEKLFCRSAMAQKLHATPQDTFKDSDCQYSIAKLLPERLQIV